MNSSLAESDQFLDRLDSGSTRYCGRPLGSKIAHLAQVHAEVRVERGEHFLDA